MKNALRSFILCFLCIFSVSAFSDSDYSTNQYLQKIASVLNKGIEDANDSWLTVNKTEALRNAFEEAKNINYSSDVDKYAIDLVAEFIKEGSEFLDTDDDEWTFARDVTVFTGTAVVDLLGGLGAATTTAGLAKGAEIAYDASQKEDFKLVYKRLLDFLDSKKVSLKLLNGIF